MNKLTRDKVISLTDKGNLVGVYFLGETGEEVVMEMPPKEADKLISLWNRYVKKDIWNPDAITVLTKHVYDEKGSPMIDEEDMLKDFQDQLGEAVKIHDKEIQEERKEELELEEEENVKY